MIDFGEGNKIRIIEAAIDFVQYFSHPQEVLMGARTTPAVHFQFRRRTIGMSSFEAEEQ